MAFDISQFRTNMAQDGARPSLFDVLVTFPVTIPTSSSLTPGADLTFKAHSSALPGDSIGLISVNYFGREIKLPGVHTFPEFNMVVYNDEDFNILDNLEYWLSTLNAHVANTRDSGYVNSANYSADVTITQYGKAGGVIKQYKLVGAFPNDVSPIEVNWASGDAIEEFTVTWAYQWWEDVPSGSAQGTTDTNAAGPVTQLNVT